jgi:hypothetical protein
MGLETSTALEVPVVASCDEHEFFLEDVFARVCDDIDTPLLRDCIDRIGRAKLSDDEAASLCVILHVMQTINEDRKKTIEGLQSRLQSCATLKEKAFISFETGHHDMDPDTFAGRYYGKRQLN